MERCYKWRLNCATDGVVYNYNEDDSAPPKCPHNDSHSVSNETIVESIEKDIIAMEARVGKTSDKMKLRGVTGTATKDSTTTINYDINEDFFVKDGALITANSVVGDKINIDLYTQDDVFQFSYVKDYPICSSGVTAMKDETLSDVNFNGLRFKISYVSTGLVNDVLFGLQLNGSV